MKYSAIVLLLSLACAFAHAAEKPHVILITIDGMAADLLDDPLASLPTLRALARQGVAATKGMRPTNPAVTWPNHTTLITGVRADRHSCFFNGVLERPGPGKPVVINPNNDQSALVAVPTLFDRLYRAGLRTAAINWPCTRGSTSVDDNFPDVPLALDHTTVSLRDRLVADGVLLDATQATFGKMGSVRRDDVWTAATCRAIKDARPALLAFHILNVDGIHHAYGPRTTPGYTALALADTKVKQVLDALDAAGIRDSTTIFVVADHGFAKATKIILPNVVFRQNGLLTAGPTAPVAARAHALSAGGTAFVYLTDPATYDADRRRAIELMKAVEGVADVMTPDHYNEINFPAPDKNRQAPDLLLVAKDGYAFNAQATGEQAVAEAVIGRLYPGHHGYLNTNPLMNAVFIAAGPAIRPGATLNQVENIDVAPTIAKILGIDLPDTDGKPIADLLK
jgi:predicted AlkP superfamily pyrophosphatase or phosphodiesterase